MPANTTLTVTDLDFDSIKTNLKTFLRSQSRFQDFDFEGSGMSVLLDLLAYNTHYNAYYLNMIANEMFLDTSKLRQSTVSHAKLINYVPESSHGAETKVNIRVTPSTEEDQNTSSLTIDKYTRLLGASIDGVNYPFITLSSNTANKDDGVSFAFANLVIKQGEVVTRQFLMDSSNTKRRFEIPSANVDINTLSVTIQESASNTQTYVYNIAEDLTEITRDSQIYFVEENEDGNYRVIFGDGVIGKKPTNGNIINITYVDTVGSVANKINDFRIVGSVGSFNDNVRVTSTSASYSGTEKETIEQVKYRAPYYYTAQNRAITIYDYETLVTKDYPNIDSVAVWGGEDNVPVVYGKVFLSLKTKEDFILSNLEKENIKDTLITNRNVLTVSPEIVDPSYTFILIRGTIYYDSTATQNDAASIKNIVNAAIEDYKTDYLGRFKSTFKKSIVQKYIEDSENSITGSDIKVILQKRVPITLSQSKNYTVDFGIPIKKGDFNSSISSYPPLGIVDSNFVERQVYFEEVPSIASGIERIDIINGGINYTTIPTVTISGDGTGAVGIAKILGGRVVSIQLINQGENYTRASVTITGDTGSGVVVQSVLQSRVGTLRTYYFNTSGEKIFVNKDAGTIDYNNGIVVLKSVLPVSVMSNAYYEPNVLTINTFADREIIESIRNKILDIDVDNPLSFQTEIVSV